MDVDRILERPDYNLRSKSRLSARDDEPSRVWLDGPDPLYAILPFPVDYVPYTAAHVITMLPLLAFALLGAGTTWTVEG